MELKQYGRKILLTTLTTASILSTVGIISFTHAEEPYIAQHEKPNRFDAIQPLRLGEKSIEMRQTLYYLYSLAKDISLEYELGTWDTQSIIFDVLNNIHLITGEHPNPSFDGTIFKKNLDILTEKFKSENYDIKNKQYKSDGNPIVKYETTLADIKVYLGNPENKEVIRQAEDNFDKNKREYDLLIRENSKAKRNQFYDFFDLLLEYSVNTPAKSVKKTTVYRLEPISNALPFINDYMIYGIESKDDEILYNESYLKYFVAPQTKGKPEKNPIRVPMKDVMKTEKPIVEPDISSAQPYNDGNSRMMYLVASLGKDLRKITNFGSIADNVMLVYGNLDLIDQAFDVEKVRNPFFPYFDGLASAANFEMLMDPREYGTDVYINTNTYNQILNKFQQRFVNSSAMEKNLNAIKDSLFVYGKTALENPLNYYESISKLMIHAREQNRPSVLEYNRTLSFKEAITGIKPEIARDNFVPTVEGDVTQREVIVNSEDETLTTFAFIPSLPEGRSTEEETLSTSIFIPTLPKGRPTEDKTSTTTMDDLTVPTVQPTLNVNNIPLVSSNPKREIPKESAKPKGPSTTVIRDANPSDNAKKSATLVDSLNPYHPLIKPAADSKELNSGKTEKINTRRVNEDVHLTIRSMNAERTIHESKKNPDLAIRSEDSKTMDKIGNKKSNDIKIKSDVKKTKEHKTETSKKSEKDNKKKDLEPKVLKKSRFPFLKVGVGSGLLSALVAIVYFIKKKSQ